MDRMTVRAARAALQRRQGARFTQVFRHGTLQVEFYAPEGGDADAIDRSVGSR